MFPASLSMVSSLGGGGGGDGGMIPGSLSEVNQITHEIEILRDQSYESISEHHFF